MLICTSCGQENREGARFCDACGAALAAQAETRREERKVVTVLFCDLVGSTAQAERMDPEDVRARLSSYHEHVRAELERWGGTVEKFIGDAVMALYGAPVAHEDDPERAVRAAFAIRDWAGDGGELQVRIGITTGETVVALGARPELGESMAAGDVVNTAARLQSAAPVNGILVDETTFRSTERAIEYSTADPVEAKGKARPVLAWHAVQPRSRYGVDVRQIGSTPLVGRERERTVLAEALERVKEERSPQLVTLVGVPGIGKSRLVWELFRHVSEGTELVTWRQGRSLPYGEGIAFWALGEIVKAQAGILETDGVVEAAAKLERTVRTLVTDDRDAAWVERHLRPLVGLEGADAGGERGEAFAAWRRFLEALAELRPLVLVFEDLHFADDGLLDFVDHLADWASGVPLLIVGTARPELLTRRAAWGGGKPNAATLSLSPLSDTETASLVHALLDRSALEAGLQQTLLERAGGNPLYAEEFARLVGEGREPAELPETVQGIVAARLDLLPSEEKRLLQDASVVGKVFWLGALASMDGGERRTIEERLHALERKEFLRRERTPSVAREVEYAFRHILVRDVAYGQIPRAERAEKHRLAAEWIASLGRAEDHAEMLAHHYLSALEYARATRAEVSSLADDARHALRDAGDRALALHAHDGAIRYYEAAIEHWPEDDLAYPRLLLSLGTALQRATDRRGEATLERAAERLTAVHDREGAAEAHALLSEDAWDRGDRARVDRHLDEARRLVRDAPPSASVARVLTEIARFRMLASETDEAIAVGREALAIADDLGLDDIRASALNTIGISRLHQEGMQGLDDLERSVEIAVATGSPEASRSYNNLSIAAHDVQVDLERSRALRVEAVRMGERFGALRTARFARGCLVAHDYGLGRWDDALAIAEQFVAESERVGVGYADIFVCALRAAILAARGELALADAESRYAVELARAAGDPQALRPALQRRAEVELELGDLASAREHASEAIAHAARERIAMGVPELVVLGLRLDIQDELLPVLTALEQLPWAHVVQKLLAHDYIDAADDLERFGDRPAEAGTRMLAAEHLIADGRQTDAELQLRKALAIYRSVGATRHVRRAEALLSASPGAQAEAPV